MKDADKTKEQLIEELAEARARLTEMEETVAERAQAEESLWAEHNMLRVLMDNTPDYVFFKDRESRFVKTNKAHLRALGLSDPEEAIGKTDLDLFPQEDAQRFYDEEQHIMASGQPVIAREWEIRTSEGETLWVSEHKIPVVDEQGQVIGLVGISSDITERKRAEEALQAAYAEIEKRVEARTAELQSEVAERERLQEEVIDAHRRALQELSTPIIPIMDRIIVMPLIGSIDSMRARDITRSLLAGIREHRAKVVILDVTGVPIVDSGVADHLNKTIQAARLKGARTVVTGISDAVAETIVDLGIDWTGVETMADLQTGLVAALGSLGIKMTMEQ